MVGTKDREIACEAGTPVGTDALRGMALHMPAGQFVTVVGSNGAGKSTFLNAISGDLMVDSGSVVIDGEDMTRKPVWDRAHKVARVFGFA